MDLQQYENENYYIEKQVPVKRGGTWKQWVFVYEIDGKHPIDQGAIEITEQEAIALKPVEPKKYPVDLPSLGKDAMGTPLFTPLRAYYNSSLIFTVVLANGYLTEDEVPRLITQLDADLTDNLLTPELHQYIVDRINTVIAESE